ncbi:unnamed protein product [Callosobruchus maculatus]|uniref:Allatostatin C n=1 Tax=Callosobruchus maculatus TaxID=64391 RepID=A0A653BWF1_CALMS|nr:unnamed protein product [Callosobruchus maculatus]
MQDCIRSIAKTFICFMVIFLVRSDARPSHLEDNQIDQDSYNSLMEPPQLKPWQMALLAQRLAELIQVENGIGPLGAEGFQRSLRSETEKKRRLRACYFNPVSCFK